MMTGNARPASSPFICDLTSLFIAPKYTRSLVSQKSDSKKNPKARSRRSVQSLGFSQGCDFSERPDVIGDPRFHRGRHAQALMDSGEIVMHEMKCDGGFVILNLFGEAVRQPSKPAHSIRVVRSWRST